MNPFKERQDMSFTYRRQYRGKIQAVLLDWAGTTMARGEHP